MITAILFFSKSILVFLTLFYLPNSGYAQDDPKDFFKVGGDIYTAPFHFKSDDWTKLGLTTAATAGAFFLYGHPLVINFQKAANLI